MRWAELHGQERAISIIRRALRSGRVPHAYLFHGPEGVGKELAATALSARLLCLTPELKPDDDACGTCRSCVLLASGNHPDFALIHRGLNKFHPDRTIRASKGLALAVDLVRYFLIEPAAVAPMIGPRRVFVVRDAERMNEAAQNALLKTLEEPPGRACLILVTSSAARLLPTIRSRCQLVPFDLVPAEFVRERLAAEGVKPDAARALADLAQGRLGAALTWARQGVLATREAVAALLAERTDDDPEQFGKRMLELAAGVAERARGKAEPPDEAEAADDEDENDEPPTREAPAKVAADVLRDALQLVLMLAAAVLRERLLASVGAGGSAQPGAGQAGPPLAAAGRSRPGLVDADRLAAGIEAIVAAERMLERNVAPQLCCERLAVALGQPA